MHRPSVTNDDAVDEGGGLIRFVDQNLPGTPGTIDRAEWNIALMEEVAYIITAAGGTLAATPLADRTAGWHQLYDAIFDSAFITSSAIDEISVSKLSDGAIDIDDATYAWYQDTEQLLLTQDSTSHTASLAATGITFSDGSNDDASILNRLRLQLNSDDVLTSYEGKGIKFENGPGIFSFKGALLRKSAFSLTGLSWTQAMDNSGDSIRMWTTNASYTTDIPDTVASIFSAAMIYTVSGPLERVTPATVEWDTAGGFIRIFNIRHSPADSITPASNVTLVLEYDAATLDLTSP